MQTNDACLQFCPSGPDTPDDAWLATVIASIYAARERVILVTPHYVPPDSLTDALCLSARRGVDVRLVLPARSNHRLADWAREPHLRALYEAGARIRLVHRMVHAKCGVIDHEVAFVGSANLDERSLLLNFEIVTVVHGGTELEAVARWILKHEEDATDWESTSGNGRQTLEALDEVVAPLL